MRKKSQEDTILSNLYKEITMMMIMLIPLILHECNLLTPFHFAALGVSFIFNIIWSSGEKSFKPATNTARRRRNRKPGNCSSKSLAMKKLKSYDKLSISPKEITAKGCNNGAVVFEGLYVGREVAVKRLSRALDKAALREVQSLAESGQHPNIVQLHGVKVDKDFVYVVVERCIESLSEFVSRSAANSDEFGQQDGFLWKSNGYPSELMLKLMRDMVEGLVHLHELGIAHQDLKPQNVMIANEIKKCAKLSEIGISKYLHFEKSSLSQNSTGCGSSRRFPMKKKLHKHLRWNSDMFNLGCVFYFCLSRGRHLFDHQLEDAINNGNNRMSLHLVNHIPEATDLISHLLDSNPKMRPKAKQVLHHPLFWDPDKRLNFLRDVSDRVERESRKRNSRILASLESVAHVVFGACWDTKMEPQLVKYIARRRHYKCRSLQHLLRVVRNMLNHYYQSPMDIQELLGPVPGGFDAYFSSRFPRLLMEVYKVVIRHCKSENCFDKYFGVDSVSAV